MLSRLQQAITLSLLIAAAGWAAAFSYAGWPHLAWVGALAIIFGYALFLALEFILLRLVNRDDPAPPASAQQLLRAWWGEVLTAPQVFCWRQPFRSVAVPDWLPDPAGEGARGVVLVHGFVCNRAVWNPWMKRLRALGVPYVAVNLEPVFGSIDEYADIIERAVLQIEAATGRAPVLVAHSMGGLAVRVWLDRYAADHRVHRVVTVGSPHSGTWLGRFGYARNTREMRLDSVWRAALTAKEPGPRLAGFTCFYSHCDNIAFPASTGTLPGADNRHVAGVAHVHLLFQNEVFNEVLRWLELPKAPEP
jgi:triacylglycerol lipase